MAGDGGTGPRFPEMIESNGEAGRNLTELGGEPKSRDVHREMCWKTRGVFGSVHVALVARAAIGGTVPWRSPLDALIAAASLAIDGRPVLKAGTFVLDVDGH